MIANPEAPCSSLVLLLALLAGCSATRSDKLDYAAEPGLRLEAPAADEAVVVFLRPSMTGHGVTATVYEVDRFVTFVMADSHFVCRTTPGEHRYAVVSETADFLDAELAGGRIYFALVEPRFGWWRARFSLTPVPPGSDAFERLAGWLAASYEVVPNAAAAAWNERNRDSVLAKCAERLPAWRDKPDRPALRPDDGVTEPPR